MTGADVAVGAIMVWVLIGIGIVYVLVLVVRDTVVMDSLNRWIDILRFNGRGKEVVPFVVCKYVTVMSAIIAWPVILWIRRQGIRHRDSRGRHETADGEEA